MNFSVGLIAGLILLFPGICALAAWNVRGAREGASRPEVPLTSVTALFGVMAVSLVVHGLGYCVSELFWSAGARLGVILPCDWPRWPLAPKPYDVLWRLLEHKQNAALPPLDDLRPVALLLLAECVFCVFAAADDGLELSTEGLDIRAQGWVHQYVILPKRNGYQPFAYVLTKDVSGDHGLGYQGTIAEVRQGADGELKSLCLSAPEQFLYRVTQATADAAADAPGAPEAPQLTRYPRRALGGVIALEAASIGNIVVHHVPITLLEAIDDQLTSIPAEGVSS